MPEEGLLGVFLKTQCFNVNASPFCQVCQAVLTVQVKVFLIIFLCKSYCCVVLRLLILSLYLKYPPKL